MRIALRTGGGRGVYELAGRQGEAHASDLFDRELCYELTPSIIIPGRAKASNLQGKPRIRLDDHEQTIHLYRLLAAILLLPKPKREFRTTHGGELLRYQAYSMTAIKIDIGHIGSDRAVIRPTDLLLETADNCQQTLDFQQRMSRIMRLWRVSASHTSPLANLLKSHMNVTLETDPDHKVIEKVAASIAELLQTDRDPLPVAERQLGITDAREEPTPSPQPSQATHQAEFGMEDHVPPNLARIKRVKKWRQLAIRGAAGRTFRRTVASAYQYRCLFTGQPMPTLRVTQTPGVDVAHILPWATHDIDSPSNGICLNKLCHWAFDEGILRLQYDQSSNSYTLDVPAQVRTAATERTFDLTYFDQLTGPVPPSHLPLNKSTWPHPEYLDELNRAMTNSTV